MPEDWEMTPEYVRVWDEELPSFFRDDVIDPCYELETYGLAVAKATLKKVVEWFEQFWYMDNIPCKECQSILEIPKEEWQALCRSVGLE